jgi:NADPH2:quinone reductase
VQQVVATRPGGPEVLELISRDLPMVPAGYALVKVGAAGVNVMDTLLRAGAYEAPQPFRLEPFPRPMGSEGAGVVEELGPDVNVLLPGDRVAWIGVFGSHATHALVPASRLVRLPDKVDLNQGAALLQQGLIAHALVFSVRPLAPGDCVLVHAAAEGTGQIITRLAKRVGATVIGTVSSEVKRYLALEAGCDHVIRHDLDNVVERVRELTDGAGVAVVYDGVGKDTFQSSLESLAVRGTLASFGEASGPVGPLELSDLMDAGSVYVTRVSAIHFIANREEYAWRSNQLMRLAAEGVLPQAVATMPLAQARRAHELIESRQMTGKILLCP